MQHTRKEILANYAFIAIGAGDLLAMIDRRDATWARKIKFGVHWRTVDKAPSAREQKGKRQYLRVMVAERYFGPRPSPAHVCRHLNGDTLDCRSENLAWVEKTSPFWQKRAREI